MKAPHTVFQHVVAQSAPVRSAPAKSTASRSSLWQRFFGRFSAFDSQLQVTPKGKPTGNEYYQIHNWFSGYTQTFASEQEAFTWLERQWSSF
jgi:hypothetical protein